MRKQPQGIPDYTAVWKLGARKRNTNKKGEGGVRWGKRVKGNFPEIEKTTRNVTGDAGKAHGDGSEEGGPDHLVWGKVPGPSRQRRECDSVIKKETKNKNGQDTDLQGKRFTNEPQ